MPPLRDTFQNTEKKGKKCGSKKRTLSRSFTTGLLGRAAPLSSQYFIRSTLQCIVLCSWPRRRRGSYTPRSSMGFASLRFRRSMATRWKMRLFLLPCNDKRRRTGIECRGQEFADPSPRLLQGHVTLKSGRPSRQQGSQRS
jgi:hypothetical protein